jgi:hypothetical protein
MSTPSSPAIIRYRVYLNEQSSIDAEIDISQPIYQIAGSIAQQYGQPGPYEEYTFFVGEGRQPLFRQFTLAQTYYAQGGDLYLAQTYAPWWHAAPLLGGAAEESGWAGAATGAAAHLLLSPRILALGGIVVVLLLWTIWAIWPRSSASADIPPAQPTQPATPTVAQVFEATRADLEVQPTATSVLPQPTTVDPQAAMALSYTDGIAAYTSQDWRRAAGLFQSIYSQNEQYLDVGEKLSATY